MCSTVLIETFLIIRRIQREIIKNVPVIFVICQENLNFVDRLWTDTQKLFNFGLSPCIITVNHFYLFNYFFSWRYNPHCRLYFTAL